MRSLDMLRLVLFSVLVSATLDSAAAMTDADISRVYSGVDSRRSAILEAEAADPFPTTSCVSEKEGRACLVGKITHGLSLFFLNRSANDVATANREIAEAVTLLPHAADFYGGAEEEKELLVRGAPSGAFHFEKAGLLYRIVRLFGSQGALGSSRLADSDEQAIRALFWEWASRECRTDDTGNRHLWTPWRSENHDAQRSTACWEAADLFRRSPFYANRPYNDGTDSAIQYADWTAYLRMYIRERGRHGLIEFFSPTYAKYTIGTMYDLADFSSDAQLKSLAHEFLDLWWAEWAEEQVGGVFGGSQTRVYPKAIVGDMPMQGASWMYFGEAGSAKNSRAPGMMPAFTSAYAPPPVVIDLALDTQTRGSYEVFTHAPGLVTSCTRTISEVGAVCTVAPDKPAVLRISYVTPEFAMGTPAPAKVPAQELIGASSQDRWAGVVMAGDPKARVVAFPQANKSGKHYNALWAVQSKATQIVQDAPPPYGANVGNMRVWFGSALSKLERNGWVFVEGAAYVAVRPASGGYHWDSVEPGWLALNDSTSPVVIQAARKSDYDSFESFQSAVLLMPVKISAGTVEVRGLNRAGVVALSNGIGLVDGIEVERKVNAAIRSPFINQAWGNGHIQIEKGDRSLVLTF